MADNPTRRVWLGNGKDLNYYQMKKRPGAVAAQYGDVTMEVVNKKGVKRRITGKELDGALRTGWDLVYHDSGPGLFDKVASKANEMVSRAAENVKRQPAPASAAKVTPVQSKAAPQPEAAPSRPAQPMTGQPQSWDVTQYTRPEKKEPTNYAPTYPMADKALEATGGERAYVENRNKKLENAKAVLRGEGDQSAESRQDAAKRVLEANIPTQKEKGTPFDQSGMVSQEDIQSALLEGDADITSNTIADKMADTISKNVGEEIAKRLQEKDAAIASASSKSPVFTSSDAGMVLSQAVAGERNLSPDKISEALIKSLDKDIQGYLSGHEKEIARAIKSSGKDPEEYIGKYIAPKIMDRIGDEVMRQLVARKLPKNATEYIMQKVERSIIGSLVNAAISTDGQKEINAQAYALQDSGKGVYNPGGLTKGLGVAAQFMADAPAMNLTGKVVAAALPVSRAAAASEALRLANRGGTGFLGKAYQTARLAPLGMGRAALSGYINFGAYNAESLIASNLATNQHTTMMDVMGAFGQGAPGLLIGGTSKMMHNMFGGFGVTGLEKTTKEKIANASKRLTADVGSFAVEAGSFTLGDYLMSGDWSKGITLTDYMEKAEELAFMKLGNPHLFTHPVQAARSHISSRIDYRTRFTPDVRKELFPEEGYMKDVSSAFWKRIDDILNKKEELSQADSELQRERLELEYKEMTKNLSWDAENALNIALFGVATGVRPRMDSIVKQGSMTYELDKDGNILSKKETRTKEELDAWLWNRKTLREQGDLREMVNIFWIKELERVMSMDERSPEFAALADEFIDTYAKGSDVDAFIRAMRDEKTETGKQFRQWLIDKGTSVDEALKTVGLTRDDLERLCNTDVNELEGGDRQLMRRAYESLMFRAFRPAEPHPGQAEVEGGKEAENAGAGSDNVDPEAVNAVSKAVDEAKARYDEWSKSQGEEIVQIYNGYLKQGMSELEAYIALRSNEHYTEDELAPLAGLINAVSRQNGFMAQAATSAQENANLWAENVGHKDGNVHTVTDAAGKTWYIKGGEFTIEDGKIKTNEVGLFIVDDEGNVRPTDGKDLTYVGKATKDEAATAKQKQLEEKTAEAVAAGTQPEGETPPRDNPPKDNPPKEEGGENPPKEGDGENPPKNEPPAGENPPKEGGTPPTDNPPVDNPPVDNPPQTPPAEERKLSNKEIRDDKNSTTEEKELAMDYKSGENKSAEAKAAYEKILKNVTEGITTERGKVIKSKDGSQWQVITKDGKSMIAPMENGTPNEEKAISLNDFANGQLEGTERQKNFMIHGAEGKQGVFITPDGEEIQGHYVLAESEWLTPSHDPFNGFNLTEGFPTKDGKTINDRAEYGNSDTQSKLQTRSQNYDGRAAQDMVVAWSDGAVMSGNDRTISGQMAARNNTDGKYIDYIKRYSDAYGFDKGQIEKMSHPRVVFVPDGELPRTTETMARFNQRTTKSQSATEAAVKASKMIRENETLQSQISEIISRVENLGDLYQDADLTSSLMKFLIDGGLVGREDLMEWMDGNLLSPLGKDRFETILLGTALSEDAIRTLRNPVNKMGKVRQNIAYAIVPLIKNSKLGDYSILGELEEAIKLLNKAKSENSKLVDYMLQLDIFDDRAETTMLSTLMLGEMLEMGPRKLKEGLSDMNSILKTAKEQGGMLFGGGTKEDILNEIIESILNKDGYNVKKLKEAYEKRKGKGAGGTGEGSGNPPSPPETADKAITPQNDEEKAVVAKVDEQLKADIAEQEERVRHAKANLEKAMAREGGKRDFFGDDDAVTQGGSLFTNSEMGYDNTAEGVKKRVEKERGILADEERKLAELKDQKTRTSRIRGALKDFRDQTKLDFEEAERKAKKVAEDNRKADEISQKISDALRTGDGMIPQEYYNEIENIQSLARVSSSMLGRNHVSPYIPMMKYFRRVMPDWRERYEKDPKKFLKDIGVGEIENMQDLQSLRRGFILMDKRSKAKVKALFEPYEKALREKLKGEIIPKLKKGKATVADVEKLYYAMTSIDPDHKINKLAKKVFDTLRNVGVEIEFGTTQKKDSSGEALGGKVRYKLSAMEENTDQGNAALLLHELIHTATSYAVDIVNGEPWTLGLSLNPEAKKAVNNLQEIYKALKNDRTGVFKIYMKKKQYGLTNVKEMVAEMANPYFREALKKMNLWKRFKDSVLQILGIDTKENADAENTLSAALDELLDQFDKDTWEKYAKKAKLLRPDFEANESRVEDEPEEISRREKTLTKVLNKVLGRKGVLGDWKEGERVLKEHGYSLEGAKWARGKRAIETAPLNQKEGSSADISTADNAKIQKKLDSLANKLEKVVNRRKKFIPEVASELGAKQDGSESWYKTFRAEGGVEVTFRLGNHNATVSNFDYRGEDNGISIVISKRSNEGITNDGEAHIVEYFYSEIALRKAYGKPLADIVRSIKNAIVKGEYKDTTGLAQRQEVNLPKFFRTANGEAYGFTYNGKVYIDPRIAGADTPIHEYTHLWAEALRQSDGKAWQKVVDVMKGEKELWDKVKELYPELKTEEELAEEVLAHYSGKRGRERLMAEIKDVDDADPLMKSKVIAGVERVSRALNDFWHKIADMLGIKYTSAERIADGILRDMLDENHRLEAGNEGLRRSDVEKGETFYSNAQKAVEGIKQEKATAEQWLKMIEKQGGMKAAEDKWLGLSDWLKEQAKANHSPTKKEILDFIRENMVKVEEVHYGDIPKKEYQDKITEYQDEFEALEKQIAEDSEENKEYKKADEALMVYSDKLYDKYGGAFSLHLTAEEHEKYSSLVQAEVAARKKMWQAGRNVPEKAFNKMVEKYGEPFRHSFSHSSGMLIVTDNKSFQRFLGVNPINSTREVYTSEGLENKREIALTVPGIEPWKQGDIIHFGDAGNGRAVAWIRFGETKDADGKRVLVIDEIQSKRHQEGRKRGYKNDDSPVEKRFRAERAMNDYRKKMQEKYGEYFLEDDMTNDERAEYKRLYDEMKSAMWADNDSEKSYDVPDAPFDKNWQELAMKRMLRYAAENGYDKIAWTKGKQQVERYSLEHQIKQIEVSKAHDPMTGEAKKGVYVVHPRDLNGNFIILDEVTTAGDMTEKQIIKAYGKDLGGRMIKAAEERTDKDGFAIIKGEDLRIGGEGMKGFYDQMLTSFMDKYGKKWGVKTGEVELPYLEDYNLLEAGGKMWSVDVTPEMRASVLKGQPMFQKEGKGKTEKSDNKSDNTRYRLPKTLKPGSRIEIVREEPKGKDAEKLKELERYVDTQTKYMNDLKPVVDILNNEGIVAAEQYIRESNNGNLLDYLEYSDLNLTIKSDYADLKYQIGNARNQIEDLKNKGNLRVEGVGLEQSYDNVRQLHDALIDKYPEAGIVMSEDGKSFEVKEVPESKMPKKKIEGYRQRTIRRAGDRVQGIADKLGLDVDIVTSDSLEGQQAKSQGFYNPETGKITIVVDNHRSATDAVRTLLHEGVAHHGLRKLFGEGFDTFLDNAYKNVGNDIKARIDRIIEERKEIGMEIDRREATEEYLANLAEDMNFEKEGRHVFMRVVRWFNDMLKKAGFDIKLDDDDLRYILQQSYRNLKAENGIDRNDPLDTVRRIAMEDRWRNHQEKPHVYDVHNPEDRKLLFSIKPQGDYDSLTGQDQKDMYEHALDRGRYVWHEAWVDGAKALEELQKALTGRKSDFDLLDAHNAYRKLIHLSSVVDAEQRKIWREKIMPLKDTIDKAMKQLAESGVAGDKKEQWQEVHDYVWMKSGLERNRVLYVRDFMEDLKGKVPEDFDSLPADAKIAYRAEEAAVNWSTLTPEDAEAKRKEIRERVYQDWLDNLDTEWYDLRNQTSNDLVVGHVDLKTYYDILDNWIKSQDPSYEPGQLDYSGLTSAGEKRGLVMVDNDGNVIDENVIDHVMDMEDVLGKEIVTDLWADIRDITNYSLNKEYNSGLLTQAMRDHISNMMNWYVPMRQWDDKQAEDVWAYMSADHGGVGGILKKKAKGRLSKPEDVFAVMTKMADNAVSSGERNKVKQALYRLALETNPGDNNGLVSVSRCWEVKKTDASGNEIWEVEYPHTTDAMSGDEVADEVSDFNERMRILQEKGEAREVKGRLTVPYNFSAPRHKSEHAVQLYLGGDPYILYINGSPRAAQVINGTLRGEQGDAKKALERIMRWEAASMTSWSPKFGVRNTFRDLDYATSNIYAKEGARYTGKFVTQWVKNTKEMVSLWRLYNKGELDMTNKTHRYFAEFMENGGKTGYVADTQIEDIKSKLQKALTEKDILHKRRAGWEGFKGLVEGFNSYTENLARFAAYVTSREEGRTILRSIADAKDASTNFNRKGAGTGTSRNVKKSDDGIAKWFNAKSAGISNEVIRSFWVFINPGVQSLSRMKHNFKEHPGRATAAFMTHAVMGAVWPSLMDWFGSLVGDDDDPGSKYYNIPEWTRRNNLCVALGKGMWIMFPLSIEGAAAFALGEIFATHFLGQDKLDNGLNPALDAASCVTQMLPIDPLSTNGENFLVSLTSGTLAGPIMQYATNTRWSGIPIQKEETPWNKYDPEWSKAFNSTSPMLVSLTKWLSDVTSEVGDSEIKKGSRDWSPAKIENTISGYLGGVGKTISDIGSFADNTINGTFDMRHFPVFNGLVTKVDDDQEIMRVNSQWYDMKEKMDENIKAIKNAEKKKEAEPGDALASAAYNDLVNKYGKEIEIWEKYENGDLKDADQLVKDAVSKEEKSIAQMSQAELRDRCMDEIRKLRKKKK